MKNENEVLTAQQRKAAVQDIADSLLGELKAFGNLDTLFFLQEAMNDTLYFALRSESAPAEDETEWMLDAYRTVHRLVRIVFRWQHEMDLVATDFTHYKFDSK